MGRPSKVRATQPMGSSPRSMNDGKIKTVSSLLYIGKNG